MALKLSANVNLIWQIFADKVHKNKTKKKQAEKKIDWGCEKEGNSYL